MLDKQTMEQLKFDEKGLIPAIVVDGTTGQVCLPLAYMNKESLDISIKEERTCLEPLPPGAVAEGETSGAVQSHIIDITADCDYDALVVRVNKEGPACHTGAESCFHNPLFESEENTAFTLQGLMDMLQGRKESPKEGSYTSYLFEKGIDKILKKKVGEESTEVIIAGEAEDKKETIYEIADLAYHVMVLMLQLGISLEEVRDEPPGTSSTKR